MPTRLSHWHRCRQDLRDSLVLDMTLETGPRPPADRFVARGRRYLCAGLLHVAGGYLLVAPAYAIIIA